MTDRGGGSSSCAEKLALLDQCFMITQNNRVGVGQRAPPVSSHFTDVLPLKSEIFDYWKERLPALGFFIDWGEPSCFACRFHYGTKYDIKRSDAGWHEIFECWNSIPLQRCHIVPRSLGGTDEVANLFLMCRECHDPAPNTNIPEIFFDWARAQKAGMLARMPRYALHLKPLALTGWLSKISMN